MLDLLPIELQILIYSFLKNPKDLRRLAYTNKYIYNVVKTLVIDKEEWVSINNIENTYEIKQLINLGYRYITINNEIQTIYNYTYDMDNYNICQIITNKNLISLTKFNPDIKSFFNKKTYLKIGETYLKIGETYLKIGETYLKNPTKILLNAPYNYIKKPIIKV
jgi:hypothetical protein